MKNLDSFNPFKQAADEAHERARADFIRGEIALTGRDPRKPAMPAHADLVDLYVEDPAAFDELWEKQIGGRT